MLRKIRIITAVIFATLITLLFLDFTGTLHRWFHVLAHIQFIPALLALHVGILIALVLLTLLLGRVYCSVICPLGVMQDGINRIAKRFNKKKRFSYSKPLTWLRWTVVGLILIAFFAGLNAVVSILDPYSIFGRIISNLVSPVYKLLNNGLAYLAERVDSYAFYRSEIIIHGGVTLAVAIVSLIVVGIMAWRNGRSYCNTICPVGTVLGFVSKFSYLKPRINDNACNSCGLCERACKASCIESKTKTIDYSRCVACMNCIYTCNRNAMKYSRAVKMPDAKVSNVEENVSSRREFLSIASLFAISTAAKAESLKVDGGLAVIIDKEVPNRETQILPAGSENAKRFSQRCTACQLCVSVCPNNILQPSNKLTTLMQPQMSFERGYCRPECVKCAEVCPSNAINNITKEEKSSTKIGNAVWIMENCVVFSDEVKCNTCSRNCPSGAIEMITLAEDPERAFPSVNNELCIGCGACEYVCPSRPFSAIYVNGLEKHRMI
jgi:polyferredoxin